MRAFLRRHLVAASVVAALGVALTVFVTVWFQPQQLVRDKTVREALPEATAPAPVTSGGGATPPRASSAPAAPVVLARGMLGDRAHHASGDVRVLRLADGRRVVRLEGLDVENGPDLFVTLAEAAADAPEDAFDRDYVSLGRLKGNKGDQTYVIPDDLDLARFRSLVIWCERFSSAFGTAPLTA